MKELASRGMAAEVVEEINAMDPNFFAQNPILLFQLKQVSWIITLHLKLRVLVSKSKHIRNYFDFLKITLHLKEGWETKILYLVK